MTWYHQKGLVTRNTHAKYQSSIYNSAKVMAKVKVFVTDGQTDRRTDGRMRFNVPTLSRKRGTIKYKGYLPIAASFLLSLCFSPYNEPLNNGPCPTRSAAFINAPIHIGFPVYNGQSCVQMSNIPIDLEFIWMGNNSR